MSLSQRRVVVVDPDLPHIGGLLLKSGPRQPQSSVAFA